MPGRKEQQSRDLKRAAKNCTKLSGYFSSSKKKNYDIEGECSTQPECNTPVDPPETRTPKVYEDQNIPFDFQVGQTDALECQAEGPADETMTTD